MFDAGVVRRCLQKEGLTRMVRSHETVQRGCIRYEIPEEDAALRRLRRQRRGQRPSISTAVSSQPLELFTVFSASKYPYKEGFNQGAILELHANGKHNIKRYETEDDDPIADTAMNHRANGVVGEKQPYENNYTCDTLDPIHEKYAITLDIIRENLFEAIHHHEGAVLRSLRDAKVIVNGSLGTRPSLSFDGVVNILVNALNLEGEAKGLKTRGAKKVLAMALGIRSIDDHVDLEAFSQSILRISRDHRVKHSNGTGNSKNHKHSHSRVSSFLDLLEETHESGYNISRNEWLKTVASRISDAMTDGSGSSDVEEIRELLKTNRDGGLSLSEWERLVEAIAMVGDDEDLLEG